MPRIGRKFPLQSAGGAETVVVINTTGKREVFRFDADDEAEAVLALSDEKAHEVGAILAGCYFQPVREDAMLQIMAGLHLRWVRAEPGSAWIGRTIRELDASA